MHLKKVGVQLKIFTYHNPVLWVWQEDGYSRRRWRSNVNLLLQDVLKMYKRDLVEFLKSNITDEVLITSVWEVKAFMRGNLIAIVSEEKEREIRKDYENCR